MNDNTIVAEKEIFVRRKSEINIIPILGVLMFVVVAVVAIALLFSSGADVPYDDGEMAGPATMLDSDVQELPSDDLYLETSDLETLQYEEYNTDLHFDPAENVYTYSSEYIFIEVETYDIHRGHLILVNSEHAVVDWDDFDLINIRENRPTTNIRPQWDISNLARSIFEPLSEMMDDFVEATGNTSVYIISGFRSYDVQRDLLNRRISEIGEAQARELVASPGHSEHHTGLAFDFGILSGGARSTFTGTGVTAWFAENAHNYGFIVRYPADKTHITNVVHEPWHFRYVGIPHAFAILQNNWVLEEYIDVLRGHSIDNPLTVDVDGVIHEIFFTTETAMMFPIDTNFEIQGNNVDGFVVTMWS